MEDARGLLKQYFGFDDFREGQKPLIDAVLEGRDVLGIMPTGAGKSLCFQIPALMMPGITLVVSPLISLMKDQVGALNHASYEKKFLLKYANSVYNAKWCVLPIPLNEIQKMDGLLVQNENWK